MPAYLVPVDRGRPIVIDKAVIFVGRHPECDVVLTSSRKISRRHCCICQVNEKLMLRDLGSMNGVRVNGTRIHKEVTLALYDEIVIGDIQFKLQAQKKGPPTASKSVEESPVSTQTPANISMSFPVPLREDIGKSEDLDDIPFSDPLDSHIQDISVDESRDYGNSDSLNDLLPD